MHTISIPVVEHEARDTYPTRWHVWPGVRTDVPLAGGAMDYTLPKARAKARASILETLAIAARAERSRERWLIGTAEGTMLLVEWRLDTWWYTIIHPEGDMSRPCGSCTGAYREGCQGFEEIRDRARKHADVYGGIRWERYL